MKEDILKLRAENKTFNEIRAIIGCSKATISYYCSEGQKDKTLERTRKKRAGLAGKPNERVKHFCCNCGGKVRLNRSKYCSHSCQHENEYNIFIKKWLSKEVNGHSGITHSIKPQVRRYMLEKSKCSCSICGWNKKHPIDGKPLVEIDHIDGNSENSFLDNLRVLCPNCHSETPTFRARNKNSSRIRK